MDYKFDITCKKVQEFAVFMKIIIDYCNFTFNIVL